jgi:hypothetical protein
MSVSAALSTFSRMNSTAISVWRPFASLRPAILDPDSAVLEPAEFALQEKTATQ